MSAVNGYMERREYNSFLVAYGEKHVDFQDRFGLTMPVDIDYSNLTIGTDG
jgi:hypothetical protein